MTRRWVANTGIKVILFDYDYWEKESFKKVSFYMEERNS